MRLRFDHKNRNLPLSLGISLERADKIWQAVHAIAHKRFEEKDIVTSQSIESLINIPDLKSDAELAYALYLGGQMIEEMKQNNERETFIQIPIEAVARAVKMEFNLPTGEILLVGRKKPKGTN